MNTINKNKGTIMAMILFVVVIMFYKTFFQKDSIDLLSGVSTPDVGANLVETYQKLKSVSFDSALFNQPAYVNLTDFSTPIAQQAVGRTNPFDLIGKD